MQGLLEKDIRAFALAELTSFDLASFEYDRELALNALIQEITEEWDELNDPEVMHSRWKHYQVPHAKATDYAEGLLELSSNKKVLYGIRHLSGNREHPFIKFKANFAFTSEDQVSEVYQQIQDKLQVFNPLSLCFWSADPEIGKCSLGATYLVASAREMKQLPVWPEEELLELRAVSDHSYYEWYQRGYQKFHSLRPELKMKVSVNSLETMEDSMAQGLLCEVSLDQQRMGLISGERSSFLGHPGIYLNEIFLDHEWQGRGLAKAVQRKFVSTFAQDQDFIWGTIDHSNRPSYQTALANGRRPIRFECFLDL